MKTQSITPNFTGKFTIPNTGNNKNVTYLYNKVSTLVKDNHVTANFHRDKIEIASHNSADKKIRKGLKQLGIEYTEKEPPKQNKLLELAHNLISQFIPQ